MSTILIYFFGTFFLSGKNVNYPVKWNIALNHIPMLLNSSINTLYSVIFGCSYREFSEIQYKNAGV